MFNFLRKIELFSELPEDDLWQLCGLIETVSIPSGAVLFEEDDPGERAYVIKEGELEVLKTGAGADMLLAVRGPGEVIGEMALLEENPRMATVRARKDSTLFAIEKEQFDNLIATSPSAAQAMFKTILARWRGTQSRLRQSEKMAQLGTMTAGVAHELNNPAAAVKRAADQLDKALTEYIRARRLSTLTSSPQQSERATWRCLNRPGKAAQTRPRSIPSSAATARMMWKNGSTDRG